MTIAYFAIIALAVWRLSNMLADVNQSGPFEIVDIIRSLAGVRYDENSVPNWKPGSLAAMLMCVYCSSVWLGIFAALAYLLLPEVTVYVSLPFALSAIAVLLETWNNKDVS